MGGRKGRHAPTLFPHISCERESRRERIEVEDKSWLDREIGCTHTHIRSPKRYNMQQISKALQSRRVENFLIKTCAFPNIYTRYFFKMVDSLTHSFLARRLMQQVSSEANATVPGEGGRMKCVLSRENGAGRVCTLGNLCLLTFFLCYPALLDSCTARGGKKFAFVSGAESTSLRQENSRKNVSFLLYSPAPPSLLSLLHVNTKDTEEMRKKYS